MAKGLLASTLLLVIGGEFFGCPTLSSYIEGRTAIFDGNDDPLSILLVGEYKFRPALRFDSMFAVAFFPGSLPWPNPCSLVKMSDGLLLHRCDSKTRQFQPKNCPNLDKHQSETLRTVFVVRKVSNRAPTRAHRAERSLPAAVLKNMPKKLCDI